LIRLLKLSLVRPLATEPTLSGTTTLRPKRLSVGADALSARQPSGHAYDGHGGEFASDCGRSPYYPGIGRVDTARPIASAVRCS
jgi:hypothetical protein